MCAIPWSTARGPSSRKSQERAFDTRQTPVPSAAACQPGPALRTNFMNPAAWAAETIPAISFLVSVESNSTVYIYVLFAFLLKKLFALKRIKEKTTALQNKMIGS